MMKSQDLSFLLISFREVLVKFWTIIMAMYFLELQTAVIMHSLAWGNPDLKMKKKHLRP